MSLEKLKKSANELEQEISSCRTIHGRLSKVVGAAERAGEYLERGDRAVSTYVKLMKEVLLHADELEKENKKLSSKVNDLEIDKKRLVNQLRRHIGAAPKSMQTDKKQGAKKDASSTRKEEKSKTSDTKKKRGAPKGHKGASRKIPDIVTEKVHIPPVSTCNCGCEEITPLDQFDEHYIEDIIIQREVIKQLFQRGKCNKCGKINRHKEALNGPPVSIGPNLSIILTIMRQRGLTYRNLSSMCESIFNIPLSPSGVLGRVAKISELCRDPYDEIHSHAKEQKVVNADETGWKIQHLQSYIWGLCNRNFVWYKSSRSRAAEVIKNILGEDYPGTVICDFYGAYNFFENLQRCLVHFFRDLHDERKLKPDSVMLKRFEQALKDLVKKGQEISELPDEEEKQNLLEALEKQLDKIINMPVPKGRPTTLRKRLVKHRDELLAFARDPEIEYHNNRAERHMRPIVISRKMSFGSDTETGAEHTCILHSVIETCKLNGKKAIDFLKDLFNANHTGQPPPDIFGQITE